MPRADSQFSPLWWIKLLHTSIWAFFVACIVALPLAAHVGRFRVATLLGGIVLVEGVVLAQNRFRWPLSDLAARYCSECTPNFDIFLPRWLAQHNRRFLARCTLRLLCLPCTAT